MLWSRVKTWIGKFKKRQSLKIGNAYAAEAGFFAGQLFIFVRKNPDGTYGFLKIPSMENENITQEKFDFGVTNDILVYVETLPRFVRNTAKLKFEENLQFKTQQRFTDPD
jgi:hypothetical protein